MTATRTYSDGRTTTEEVLNEVQWMLDADVHPRLILQELGKSAGAIEKAARNRGRREISAVFWRVISEDKHAARQVAA